MPEQSFMRERVWPGAQRMVFRSVAADAVYSARRQLELKI